MQALSLSKIVYTPVPSSLSHWTSSFIASELPSMSLMLTLRKPSVRYKINEEDRTIMSAFCGLKMATQTNQSKFTATHLSSLEEQVLQVWERSRSSCLICYSRPWREALLWQCISWSRWWGHCYSVLQDLKAGYEGRRHESAPVVHTFTALTTFIEKMKTGSERDRAGLLGMTWNPKEDTPQFPPKAIVIPPDVRFTKRQVLSSAKSKFDPIGLIFPVLVPAKKLSSSLWYKGFDWDEVPPDEP